MVPEQTTPERAVLNVENVGGIDNTEISFSPGVTVLSGRNATNRTSLLQGLMAALGSDNVSIKGGADEATVTLDIGGETYRRRLIRRNGTVVTEGDPYLSDTTVADLFAFLLESNEARQAIRQGQDLREIIMRPVDTEAIQAEVDQLVEERTRLEKELEEIDSLKGELPQLEERRTSLQNDIEEKRAELEAKETELENADIEETREEKQELEERLSDLRSKRSKLEEVRYDIDTERETIESLRSERNELEDELADLPETPTGDADELASRIDGLRNEKQALESEINELQSIIGFNEELLGDADTDVVAALQDESSGDLTDQLLESETTTCWTCGSEVAEEQIEQTIDQLRELSQAKFTEINEIDSELGELTDQRRELQKAQSERDRIERRLSGIERELEESQADLEALRERRETLTDEVGEIEEAVEELEGRDYSDVLDVHREANQLEYDLGRLENELEELEEKIERIETRVAEEEERAAELEDVEDEITALRTKIGRIEEGAIEGFNEHMDTVLDLLEYENLERIWIERTEREVREGRRKVQKAEFELHIVRNTASNRTYEDTIDHLSESESEVTGLIFALAGYLAHEVHEQLPFVLLDSLEAIDAERLSVLIEYLDDHADYLIVALLTEDANAVDDGYERITEI